MEFHPSKKLFWVSQVIWMAIAVICVDLGFRQGQVQSESSQGALKKVLSSRQPSSSQRNHKDVSELTSDFMQAFLSEQDAVHSSASFSRLISSFDESNASEVASQLKEALRLDSDLEHYYRAYLAAWAERDPHAVLTFLGPVSEVESQHLQAVVAGWIRLDPVEAKLWLGSLPSNKIHDRLRYSYFSSMAKQHLAGITREIYNSEKTFDAAQKANIESFKGPGLPSQLESGDLISAVANEVAKRGREQATSWVDTLPDGSLKASAFREIAGKFNDDENRGVIMDWIKKWSHTEHTIGAAGDVIFRFSKSELPAAAEWANSLGAHGRQGSLPHAIDRWADVDPQAASDFLSTQPADETRDSAAWKLIGELRWKDIPTSLEWAKSIKSDYYRDDSFEMVATRWLQVDESAAMEWLQTSPLSSEKRERVLKKHEENR